MRSCKTTLGIGLLLGACLTSPLAGAGAPSYELLSASVRSALQSSLSDKPVAELVSVFQQNEIHRRSRLPGPLRQHMPDEAERMAFLNTVYYEASRAGLDPVLVLGVIQAESGFRKYAVSSAGARGLMQVMPFWVDLIGRKGDNLFHLRTNLRYGCTILRHYLDRESGNVDRALGRYHGSVGSPTYPALVSAAWSAWR